MTDKNHERDASVGRLLAGTLKARVDAAPDAGCLDAETLAAWADESLDARERAAAEAHATDCGRCQALLAAMVKTAPPAVVAASPSRSRALWWIAALAPVAAALLVWFAVPSRVPVAHSDETAQVVDQMAAAPSAPRTQALDKPETLSSPQAENERDAPPKDNAAESQSALAKERDASSLDQKAIGAPPATASANAAAEAPTPSVPPAAAADAASASAPAAASVRREAASASARLNAFAGALDVVVVSSNPSTRFRLLRGGGVQRTADAGATWRTETTGATETLTGGASPSPSVCWLIGPSGTVLLSTDGRSWRRVAFPEAVDLRSVTATDGENATVTTVDGRAFVTTDGGRTWARPPDF